MADMMVLVSKGEFEKAHKQAKLGDKLAIDAYNSAAKALSAVEGGTMFLVTVRPPDEGFWLVAVLEKPEFDGERWTAKKNVTPITDLGALRAVLKFANGKGVPTEPGKLGMSLQTPRVLTDEDVALLRKATGGTPAPKKPEEKKKPEPKKPEPVAIVEEAPPIPAASGDLGAAKTALERGDRRAALEALLEAWRGCRAPEIETVIAVVSADLARAYEPIEAPAKEFDPLWSARAAKKDVADLPHLLASMTHDPRGSLPLRLRAILELPPDPRVAETFLEMIEDPPITASSNFSFWTTLFGVLPKYLDTRATKRLEARARKKGGDSQFWPKLTAWIEKVVPQLPEPARADAKLCEALRKAAEKSAASGVVEKPKETPAAKVVATTGDPLADAESNLLAKRPDDALEALVRFWGGRRNPEVAALIEKLGEAIDTTLPTLVAGKPADIHAAWLGVGRTPRASDVGRLLAALKAGKLSDADERLISVVQWPPDPRVGKQLALYFSDYMLGSRPTFWKLVYDAFVHHADPRQRALILERAEWLENAAAFDRNRSERAQLRRIRAPFVEACDRNHALSPAEAAAVARVGEALDAFLAARVASAAESVGRERALIRAIVDAWDDEQPRSVYADMLSEAGDPRGEYISMALADASGRAKLKSKLAELEKKQKAALLGPIAPVAYKSGWSRGLLDSLEIDNRGADWDDAATCARILDDVRWCTLRTLSFFSSSRQIIELVFSRAQLWALERLEDVDLVTLPVLFTHQPMLHLKTICWGHSGFLVQTNADDEDELGEAPDATWFALEKVQPPPSLEHIELHGPELPPVRFFRLPLVASLKHLTAGARGIGGTFSIERWIARLLEMRFPGQVTVSCWLYSLEWSPDRVARLRFHQPLKQHRQGEVQQLGRSLEALAGLSLTRVEWSTDEDATALPALEKSLDAIGAIRV